MYVYQRVVNHTINDKLTINYSNYILSYITIYYHKQLYVIINNYISSYNYSILLVNGFVHLKLEAISPIPTTKKAPTTRPRRGTDLQRCARRCDKCQRWQGSIGPERSWELEDYLWISWITDDRWRL